MGSLVKTALRYLERWPMADLGAPGPLTHFIESVSDVTPLILESGNRAPNYHSERSMARPVRLELRWKTR